ncbi:transcriptional regulator [Halobacteriales archaeon QS_4_69_34]|nr:MAG: transcriptional regulator [Halobacteriales archaeon QS_4_69_34]
MDDRDEGGKFREQYPEEAFVRAVAELPVASTQNVADEVGCSYDLAYRRLPRLEDEGKIEHESVGRSFVWVLTDEK